ncbi:MAG TPA: ABC transporter substrate-binding protein, partial [Chloroflexota bacterium]|nr:ABC transporter substrate-binding protein [Chloroflexota bacterium]
HTTPQLFTEFLVLNEKHAPLNNPLVREALSYAINRTTIAKLLKNRFLPAHGMLPPGMPGYNKSQVGQVYDPAKAQALLAKAGYPGGKGFPKLTLNVDGGDNDGETKAVAYTEFWKQVLGITVGINQLEHGAYINALTGHNFDIATIQWGADYPDPNDFLSLIWQTGAGANNGSYSNAQVDALTKQADAMPHDSPARYQKYQQAESIMLNQAGGIMMLWGRANVLIRPSVHGLQLTALGGGYLLAAPNWANVTVS